MKLRHWIHIHQDKPPSELFYLKKGDEPRNDEGYFKEVLKQIGYEMEAQNPKKQAKETVRKT